MTYEQLIGDLKNKVYKPVYFLFGEEPYYIDLISSYIAANVLSEAEQSFNQTVLYGKDSEAGQVSDLARRFPMMASHLEKQAVLFESKKLYDNQVAGWIAGYVTNRKYRMEPKAAALLAEFLGSDLGKIVNEVEKLIVAIGEENQTITPALVEKHIGFSKDFNQFELQDALGRRDVVKANRIINYFAENEKKYPFPLTIISLYYFFSKLLLFHYTKDKSRQNLAATLKVNPFFVKDYEAAAKRYSAARLVEIISLLRIYDMRSKGYEGNTTPSGELTRELIFKILHT